MKTIGEIVGQRDAYSIGPDATVKDAATYLDRKGIGAVAVCEGDDVVGVFSERDVVRRVVAKGLDPIGTTVRDVMTPDVICVSINESLHTAQALMLNRNFRHLVVVDEERRLRGFVSMRELLEVDLAESKQIIGSLNDEYYDHRFKPGVA